ncbi:MAG TPA: hypothetical protein VNB94_10845, partial [Mycobacteriales bacterium]|nr:hypothetical protein [Mycobacteriales bacterium]
MYRSQRLALVLVLACASAQGALAGSTMTSANSPAPGSPRSAATARLGVHAVDGVLPAKAQLAGVDAAAAARAAGTSTARLTWRASGPAGFPPL